MTDAETMLRDIRQVLELAARPETLHLAWPSLGVPLRGQLVTEFLKAHDGTWRLNVPEDQAADALIAQGPSVGDEIADAVFRETFANVMAISCRGLFGDPRNSDNTDLPLMQDPDTGEYEYGALASDGTIAGAKFTVAEDPGSTVAD